MDRLWAPWRTAYVIKTQKKQKCIFCIPRKPSKLDKAKYIVERSKYSFSILNKYPYNNGHLMVAPYKHVKFLDLLSDEELLDLMKLVSRTKIKLEKVLRPHGFNIGINAGRVAGAGIPGHVHIHIVPRWNGDTNFMPVTGMAKVISESLGDLYKRVKNAD